MNVETCANGTHRAVDPRTGARIESSGPIWLDYSATDEPARFSCCLVHTINHRRAHGVAIPFRWAMAPRWARRLAVWWYTRHPVLPTRQEAS